MANLSKELARIKITALELTPVHVPFKKEVLRIMQAGTGGFGMALKAEEAWTGGDFVILRILTDSGHAGLGEAFVWLPETGETPRNVVAIIHDAAARYVLGENPFSLAKIVTRLHDNIARNEVAKGLIDMAIWDLQGRILGKSLWQMWGRRDTDKLPLAGCVPLTDVSVMQDVARMFVQDGMKTLRFKLGLGVEKDAAIMATMRKALGDRIRFRVDYNQVYTADEAVAAIKGISPYGIDVVEQPVARGGFTAMAYVQKRVPVPLMAHEGSFGFDDIETLLAMQAIRVVGINNERPGGISLAWQAIDFAKALDLGVVIHNQPLGIGSAMLIQLGASRFHDLKHDVEVLGAVMLEDDLLQKPLVYDKGFAVVPNGPGLGVDLDEEALAKYATAPTVRITR